MLTLVLGLALSASLPAAEPVPLSLADLEAAVAAKNPGLQAMRRSADQARAAAQAAAAWADPQLSVEWMQLRWPEPVLSDAGRRRFELSQSLPLFGQAGAKGRAGEHAAQRALALAMIEQARLSFEAKDAYWRAQEAGHLVRSQERSQRALAALRKVSAQRARFGRLDRMGQLMDAMLERELGTDEAMGLHWQSEERAARFKLERLMGGESIEALAPVDVAALMAASWNADELWGKGSVQNPELQETQHHVLHARAEQSAMRREWLPELMLEGGYEEGMGMNEASFKAGINLPWLWFWGQRGRVQAAGFELQHAQAMAKDAELMLREQCRMLASELHDAQAQLKLSVERILPAAEKALEAGVAGYSSGDIATREAMDAVMGYWKANEDYAHRLWHVGSTLAAIDRLMAAPVMEMSHD